MSKGSKQRPAKVPPSTVERNWRRTFGEGVRAKVRITAPTSTQLHDTLLAEMKAWIGKMPAPMREELYHVTADRVEFKPFPHDNFISAVTSRADQPDAMHGVHAKRVLIIGDEASGIPDPVYEASVGSMSSTASDRGASDREAIEVRVLAGGPARETSSDLFLLHHIGLMAQDTRKMVIHEGTVDDDLPGDVILREPPLLVTEVTTGIEVCTRHEIVPDSGGPRWHHDKIARVAQARQKMLDEAVGVPSARLAGTINHRDGWQFRSEWDALLMVDTDVILGPGVLERMWAVDAPVVFGVFWTKADWGNSPGIEAWPQVWDRHSYRFTEECWTALTAPGVNEVPVLGGGACTLIRGRGFESHYWPLLKSLSAFTDMFSGEDRAYCLGLEARGIPMVAVTGLPIVHLYSDDLRTPKKLAEARELVGLGPQVLH